MSEQLQGELDRLERMLVETIALSTPVHTKGGDSTVTINAGGAGVWIAVTCCIVSFVINLGLAVAFLSHDRKIERLQDYISAIYMQAPHLKPEE